MNGDDKEASNESKIKESKVAIYQKNISYCEISTGGSVGWATHTQGLKITE